MYMYARDILIIALTNAEHQKLWAFNKDPPLICDLQKFGLSSGIRTNFRITDIQKGMKRVREIEWRRAFNLLLWNWWKATCLPWWKVCSLNYLLGFLMVSTRRFSNSKISVLSSNFYSERLECLGLLSCYLWVRLPWNLRKGDLRLAVARGDTAKRKYDEHHKVDYQDVFSNGRRIE